MTYRDRRRARAERLREWADKRDGKAQADHAAASERAAAIPLGQPILVGHHSEQRDRNYRARTHDLMDRSVAHARKARDMRSRADEIDAQADHAIYDDDPDATERLAERIAALEAERERIKAYNASCRKGHRDESILTEQERARLLSTAKNAPYQLGKQGEAPRYWLTNLGGRIKRDRDRLRRLQAKAPKAWCEDCGEHVPVDDRGEA